MPSETFAIPVPTKLGVSDLADWAEAIMILDNRGRISKSMLRGRLRSLADDGEQPDEIIELTFGEVKERRKSAPSTYPFHVSDVGIERVPEIERSPYEFLLWLSFSPVFREEKRFNESDVPFDEIAASALRALWGPYGQAVRFGFPPSGERPNTFPGAIAWLCEKLNLPVGAAKPSPQRQDGGVDVIAWRPFQDRRSGFSIILCQCTVQIDWKGKGKDIESDVWRGWVDLGKDPTLALAIPFAVPAVFDRWDEVRRSVHIILDRGRLCELVDPTTLANLDTLRNWCEHERDKLRELFGVSDT